MPLQTCGSSAWMVSDKFERKGRRSGPFSTIVKTYVIYMLASLLLMAEALDHGVLYPMRIASRGIPSCVTTMQKHTTIVQILYHETRVSTSPLLVEKVQGVSATFGVSNHLQCRQSAQPFMQVLSDCDSGLGRLLKRLQYMGYRFNLNSI